jgi:HEAT repeat protein
MLIALMLLSATAQTGGDPVAGAIEKLHSDRIELREEGVRELALLGDAAARALQPLLVDEDPELAARAKRALEMNRRTSALPRSLAVRRPSLLERDVPMAELLALPLSPDEERFFAARAADTLDLPPSTWYRIVRSRVPATALARAFREGRSDTLRAYALAALQEVDALAAVRVATTLLRSPSVELRVQAAFTIGEAGPVSAAADLKRLLRDASPAVRDAAAIAIRRLAPAADVAAPPAPALSRADALTVFASAVDGRAIDDPVLFTPVPRARDAPASLEWIDVMSALGPQATMRDRWFGYEIVIERRTR